MLTVIPLRPPLAHVVVDPKLKAVSAPAVSFAASAVTLVLVPLLPLYVASVP